MQKFLIVDRPRRAPIVTPHQGARLRAALSRLVDLAPDNEDEDAILHAALNEARAALSQVGAP